MSNTVFIVSWKIEYVFLGSHHVLNFENAYFICIKRGPNVFRPVEYVPRKKCNLKPGLYLTANHTWDSSWRQRPISGRSFCGSVGSWEIIPGSEGLKLENLWSDMVRTLLWLQAISVAFLWQQPLFKVLPGQQSEVCDSEGLEKSNHPPVPLFETNCGSTEAWDKIKGTINLRSLLWDSKVPLKFCHQPQITPAVLLIAADPFEDWIGQWTFAKGSIVAADPFWGSTVTENPCWKVNWGSKYIWLSIVAAKSLLKTGLGQQGLLVVRTATRSVRALWW